MLTTCYQYGGNSILEKQSAVQQLNTGSEGDPDEETAYIGKRDAEGRPHGRGTLTWLDSKTRFEGRFENGNRRGRGCLYFSDGSTLSGRFEDDNLEGVGVYTYSDGSAMEAWYSNGDLDGRLRAVQGRMG